MAIPSETFESKKMSETNCFSRTEVLFGAYAMQRLSRSRVAVFGVGGVGGYVVEILARSGVGAIDIVDSDCVSPTNLNRQIIALRSTLGMKKVEVCARRILDINPDCKVTAHDRFYLPENAHEMDLSRYDYVVDCIDTVSAKVELIRRCQALGVPLLCCMGAANKMDPSAFRVSDISKTKMDPLAKVIRRKLRELHIAHQKCVWSEEIPRNCFVEESGQTSKRRIPASNAFVPAAAGLLAGSEVVKDLIA